MATKTETPIEEKEPTVHIYLPTLEEESPGHVDQSVSVVCNGKRLRILRGEHVEVPVWAYEILRESGRFQNL